ncbi:MAG: fibronectin type III domain-containing protein, partial [Candidatus Delongbacteria bacterium]|nr:fibronectin type III domain-containing protein [Candidatus Delongbacteria bacterium]
MKKTLLILTIIAAIAITFFACTERVPTHPLDPEYWDGKEVAPVTAFTHNPFRIDSVKLSWTAPESNPDGYKYRLDKKVGAGKWQINYKIFSQDQMKFSEYAEIGQTISYRLYVFFDENISDLKEKSYTNTFQAPTNLTATQTSITSANLSWTDNSIGEEKFEIERKLSTESTYVKVAEVTGSDTATKSWNDTATIPNLTYDYKVTAVKGINKSAAVTKQLANPFQAPTNLTATQTSITSANLSWTDNSIGEEKFEIERKLSTESTYVKVAEVTGSDTATKSWADTNLVQDLTYDYRVKAVKGVNCSAYITKTGYLNAFNAPTNFTATFVNYTSVTLSWADSYIGEDKYEVERKLSTESTYIKIDEVTGSDTSTKSYADTTIEPNLSYNYRVCIVDGTAYSAYALVTHANPFQAPTGLTAAVASETSIKLDWTDNSAYEQGFKIDRKIGAAGSWVTDYATVGASVKTYTNTGLTTGTTYYYKVRAYYSTYYSSYTSEVNAIPLAPAGFVSIPTGSVSMGQTDVATPVHTVNITRPYYLGKYEVTQQEWTTTMGSNPASGYG